MKKITISIRPFLQSSFIINLGQKGLAFSEGMSPAHEAESRIGEAIRCNLVSLVPKDETYKISTAIDAKGKHR